MKTLKPGYFGHRGCLGKKVEAKEANRVSAKCAIACIGDEAFQQPAASGAWR
jgi:hypothetical protein